MQILRRWEKRSWKLRGSENKAGAGTNLARAEMTSPKRPEWGRQDRTRLNEAGEGWNE